MKNIPPALPSPASPRGPRARISRAAWALACGCAAAALCAGLGCKPKTTTEHYLQEVGSYAKDAGKVAQRLGTKTGAALGLLKKKPDDYVRLAWGEGDAPAATAEYTPAEEREVGRALAAEFIGHWGRYENEALERYLNLVAASLCAFSDRPGLPCCVGVLASEEIRCFSAPGGYVLVTLGALRVCRSEAELAGLLAHGLAQIRLRHALARLDGLRADLDAQAAAAAGTPAPAERLPLTRAGAHDFTALIETAAELFAREDAAESDDEARACDREATTLLVRLGYEPGGLKAFLKRQQLCLQERAGGRPLANFRTFQRREETIDGRLAELCASPVGRSLKERYRRECQARLPAPRLAP